MCSSEDVDHLAAIGCKQETVKIIIVAHVLMPWLVRTMGQVALSSTNQVVDNPLAAPGTII